MDTLQAVKDVGFPIFIALLFYLDLRKVVKGNTKAIDNLTLQQHELTKAFREGEGRRMRA